LFVVSINISPSQWHGNDVLDREGAENKKYKFRFAPKFPNYLHQPKMFNGSRVFAYFLFIESKR